MTEVLSNAEESKGHVMELAETFGEHGPKVFRQKPISECRGSLSFGYSRE